MTSGGASTGLTREQRAWQMRVLMSTYLAYGGYYLTRKVFAICKPSLAEEFGVTLSQVAHIWTAFLVAYMVGQFLSSYLGRKWGPRVLLTTGLAVSMAINVAFGFTNSYATFLAFMIFNGLAQATGWPGAVGGVAQWIRKQDRGAIMGFWSTNYQIGNIGVKTLGAFILEHYGWSWSFWGCTMVAALFWVILYCWQRDRPEDVGLPPIVEPEAKDTRAVQASTADRVTFAEYMRLALNPIVITMGFSYICIKFLRYSLDSWLPSFFWIMGLDKAQSGYYSVFFDIGGIIPAVIAGWLLDRVFKGNWPLLCFLMSLGLMAGYMVVIAAGSNPVLVAASFGLVGFMLYGPDTLLCGAAAVQVAGEKNGVAVAGLVNGIASIGPVIQEELIGWLVGQDQQAGLQNANKVGLVLTFVLAATLLIVIARVKAAQRATAQKSSA